MIYYSPDSPSSLITESLSVTQSLLHTRRVSRITVKALVTSNIIQSVCLVGKGQLKERCRLEPRTNFFFPFKKSARTSADSIRLDSRIYGIFLYPFLFCRTSFHSFSIHLFILFPPFLFLSHLIYFLHPLFVY